MPHPGTLDGDLLAGEGGHAALVAVARVGTVWLPLISRATEASDLVLQEAGGDQQAQLQRQALEGVLHQLQEFLAIQGQLDLTVAGAGLPSRCGLAQVLLVGTLSVLVISLQGGSSLSRVTHKSSLRTGREEPPLLTFQLRVGHPP
jgi:hypothetical protein